MSDFLFELGVEEVPVPEAKSIIGQLAKEFKYKLQENQVSFDHLETAATNKRFMVYIGRISDKAEDTEEQVKGPAKRIAYDENNRPTVPLKKFMEANNAGEGDLEEVETKKGVYMVVNRKTQGAPTSEIMARIIPEILNRLSFGKTMVWNASRVPFVRPVKSLLALFDNEVVPFRFAGVRSSNTTRGHILLCEEPLEVNSFIEYCETLDKNFVIAREDERKQKIVQEIKDIEEEFQADVKLDAHMLADYIYNNEYPVVFCGKFGKKYLELPSEIISTFMVKEKKLLPVYGRKSKKLLNLFVGVSNIPDEGRNVVSGNERVIRATFEDAKFFWDNDRKDDFMALREQLNNVNFHKELGTYFEKTERLASLVDFLLKELDRGDLRESLRHAALNSKNDLVTRMVREFPSLQGVMGGLYMKEKDESEATWRAVYGHYEPKGFQPVDSEQVGAALLSVADKIDNITAFISKGIKISSSKDPYGIRRDANGVLRVIMDCALDFDLLPLIRTAAKQFVTEKEALNDVVNKVAEFFRARLENVCKDFLKIRYDVINSVLTGDGLWVYRLSQRLDGVAEIVKNGGGEGLAALHKRLKNIIKKSPTFEVSKEHLVEEEEKILFDIVEETVPVIMEMSLSHRYVEGCARIMEMKPVIDNFFDKVLVMAEDQRVRENRIGLLQKLDLLLCGIADFSEIVE